MTKHRSLPTLDVVVLCYNEAEDIGVCLDHLLRHRNDLVKVYVVDNASTDSSKDIILSYVDKYPDFISYVYEPQQGVQFARNAGLDIATSDIIARIDADTRVEPNWAHAMRTYYANNPTVAAAHGQVAHYDLPFRRFVNAISWFFMIATNELMTRQYILYGANMSIRKSAWNKVRGDVYMGSKVMEDLCLSLVLHRKKLVVGYIPEVYALVSSRRYRTSPASFYQYNNQWWRTYWVHGYRLKAVFIWLAATMGDIGQALVWVPLLFHDPQSNRVSLTAPFRKRDRRDIP